LNKPIITILFLCSLLSLSNNFHSSARESPRDEARFAGGFTSVDDSSLKNHRDYQRWKKALLGTRAGRALWGKWNDRPLTVHITMGEHSGGPRGAVTKDFQFDDAGKLTEATIVLGVEFAKDAPRNKEAYPVLVALARDYDISREARAVAFLAHEFGHVENTRRIGGAVYQLQSQLLDQNEAGFVMHGWDWFKRPEYQRIVTELGCAPFEIGRQRENGAEAFAIPVIVDYYQGKPPATVQQAIRSYREEYPLSLAVTDTQRTLASALDAELPRLSFAEWFGKVVGPDAGIIWQLSECGGRDLPSLKATGDIPACVEANAMLPDGRRVILMTAVGSFKKGVTGAPRFDFGVIEQGGELYPVRRLRDLQAQLSNPKSFRRRPSITLPDLRSPESRLVMRNTPAAPPAVWSDGDLGQDAIFETEDLPQPPEPPRLKPAGQITEKLKVLGTVSWGGVISKAQPRYPPSAKKYNISGPVDVEVTISEAGRVTEAKAVSGHPLLRGAAEEAARQWVFRPATLKGVPVQTQIALTFVFKAPQ
jgi:TonB family protein